MHKLFLKIRPPSANVGEPRLFSFIYLVLLCPIPREIRPGRLPRVKNNSRKSSATHSFQSVCVVFSCVQTMVWLPVFWIFKNLTILVRWTWKVHNRPNEQLTENSLDLWLYNYTITSLTRILVLTCSLDANVLKAMRLECINSGRTANYFNPRYGILCKVLV